MKKPMIKPLPGKENSIVTGIPNDKADANLIKNSLTGTANGKKNEKAYDLEIVDSIDHGVVIGKADGIANNVSIWLVNSEKKNIKRPCIANSVGKGIAKRILNGNAGSTLSRYGVLINNKVGWGGGNL